MHRPVMVALDGSEKDERAIAVGSALGRLSQSDLHFVRVVADSVEHSAAEAGLVRTTAAQTASSDGHNTHAVLHSPDVAAALIRHVVERDALLIVMATRAPSTTSRAIAGSVADEVMRESLRPVVLVPPGAGFLAGKQPTITRVL